MFAKMLNFLKQTRKFVNSPQDSVCIVMGNESCDLDSAVCAVSLAYFHQVQQQQEQHDKRRFLPVLNIPRRDYPLKTEIQYIFNKFEIPAEDLTFRDELHEDFLERSNFILVDHHVSPFTKRCLEIYDHRPFDASATSGIPAKCEVNIELVGSCATLIGELIVKSIEEVNDTTTLSLLRSAIILDTVNFSEAAKRSTPKDHEVCIHLERILGSLSPDDLQTRDQLFQTLCRARADVSSLTALQLLRKDLKFLSNAEGSITVALPGFPLPVQRFIEKSDAAEALKEFAAEFDCSVVLLLGMFVLEKDGSVQRDVGLIDVKKNDLCEAIRKQLLTSSDPPLLLQHYADCKFMGGHFYKQENITATRKHILPMVKQVLTKWPKEEN